MFDNLHFNFHRFYYWSADGDLSFRTRMEIKGGQVYESAIPLIPLTREHLMQLLGESFDQVEFFGGLDGRPYVSDGLPLMLLARKK